MYLVSGSGGAGDREASIGQQGNGGRKRHDEPRESIEGSLLAALNQLLIRTSRLLRTRSHSTAQRIRAYAWKCHTHVRVHVCRWRTRMRAGTSRVLMRLSLLSFARLNSAVRINFEILHVSCYSSIELL